LSWLMPLPGAIALFKRLFSAAHFYGRFLLAKH
jgi:hypothetical protein